MIIPVRCFTCHKVIGNKWDWFNKQRERIASEKKLKRTTQSDIDVSDIRDLYFSDDSEGKLLDEMGLVKLCCRRHMLTHIDLIDII